MTVSGLGRSLYSDNHPARFWRPIETCHGAAEWGEAIAAAVGALPTGARHDDIGSILEATLGEGQFGADHWRLSRLKRLYYQVKPLLPRPIMLAVRHAYGRGAIRGSLLDWPVEDRYAAFLMGVVRNLLQITGEDHLDVLHFWPSGHRFALVLTHDVETAEGQDQVLALAELESRMGFRSSFNFIPERYRVDLSLVEELRSRGFEICIHDLRHDGKLFSSRAAFREGAQAINRHLDEYGAVGFRAGLTHRNPVWMQDLAIEYDMSFFDTDPFEPINGGTMSLWPFTMGGFLELPYTLVQDNTLMSVLGERSPRIWVDKVDYIASRHGLALVNAHPDYLRESGGHRQIYARFLEAMAKRHDLWHALPVEVCRWWRARDAAASPSDLPDATVARITDAGWDGIVLSPAAAARDERIEARNPA